MAKTRFPPGWDQQRVQGVLTHYETQPEHEAVAEDEAEGSTASESRRRARTPAAGWGAIKTKLKGLGVAELVNLLRDVHQASPENRQFLRGRLLPSAADLETYRDQVIDAIFPDPFSRRPVSVAEAERLIRHYRLSTHDKPGVVDLMLSMVEAGTEQSVDLAYVDDSYFASLERVLEGVVKALPLVPEPARPSMVRRLQALAERASPLGWGYGDAVRQITAAATSPPTKRTSARRASRP